MRLFGLCVVHRNWHRWYSTGERCSIPSSLTVYYKGKKLFRLEVPGYGTVKNYQHYTCVRCSKSTLTLTVDGNVRKLTCHHCEYVNEVPATFTCVCGKEYPNDGQMEFSNICPACAEPRCPFCAVTLEWQVGCRGAEVIHHCVNEKCPGSAPLGVKSIPMSSLRPMSELKDLLNKEESSDDNSSQPKV